MTNLVDVLFHPNPRHEGSPRNVDGMGIHPGDYRRRKGQQGDNIPCHGSGFRF